MKRFGIYVFSGTGNTMKCAELLLEELAGLGAEAEIHDIEKSAVAAKDETMILCYPVHGFNAAAPMLKFCRKLPKGRGDIWFLKTSGEAAGLNGNSSGKLIKCAERKGYTVKGEFHFVMPYNMVFRHSDEMASLMWETAQKRMPDVAKTIIAGKGQKVHASLSSKLLSRICSIEYIFYPVNGRLFHVDTDRCIKCMRCVESCPEENIRFEDGKFHFGGNCVECTRCSFACPVDAIHIGLLNFMKVNGPYDFNKDSGEAEIGWFCRKSYIRYFEDQDGLLETGE